MPDDQQTVSIAGERGAVARVALVKVLILLGLFVWAFWSELRHVARAAIGNSDWAHGLVVPVAILILALRRRSALAAVLTRGSVWGVLLLLFGLGLHAVFIWPCSYSYPRQAVIVAVVAGIVLAICGWRVLKLCLPMLLLFLLSIPVSPRAYAALIIRPETYTLSATRFALDQLPGVDVRRDGPDLSFSRKDQYGTIALGEPRRGASLFTAYVAIGVFVVFARIRPVWQIMLLALAAVPITLLCNFLRIVCWGLIAIYTRPDPVNPVPRAVAATISLLLAYLLFAFGCWVLVRVDAESDADGGEGAQDVNTADGQDHAPVGSIT
jgi:exosortase